MIVITKKKILRMLGICSFAILSISLLVNIGMKNPETQETVSLPVTNKVIVIDARAWCTR